jgi:glucose-1-phosphate thymidylyltransferase
MVGKSEVIILAGGSGSRLASLSRGVNKHLLPVFDEPVIYPLRGTRMIGGLSDFIVVSGLESLPQFEHKLGDGSRWGLNLRYTNEEKSGGIAECFGFAADDTRSPNVTLILGHSTFHSDRLSARIANTLTLSSGATMFATEVADPLAFITLGVDYADKSVSLVEKATSPLTNIAVPGLYCYDQRIVDFAWSLKPSERETRDHRHQPSLPQEGRIAGHRPWAHLCLTIRWNASLALRCWTIH